MALMKTPLCEFGKPCPDFALPGVDGRVWTRDQCKGPNGLLVMFICNHCPYVKAILDILIEDCREISRHGVGCVAINPNDTERYPEDSFDNMKRIAAEKQFPFPYLLDETQEVARAFGAICTPDFFGYNAELQLQYRGRLIEGGKDPVPGARHELLEAMKQIAATGRGPEVQYPSMGCSIKWKPENA
ncbi:hypothetical protein MIT9_P2003 [Methylomarinovum caldicuralii]|uniref:Thioredoxin domain-containing protein n=1 Tax=Methylomarinovum caldicuralii TaxID=438856 RepID=A0AAU9CWQ6_9GAMM|nr:thioredoxin family protein [Methylomarinovum caldicuralii]BCX82417.1 hypothetical protein MIT9_P2003 [Methylomarinovum caldicuralii]